MRNLLGKLLMPAIAALTLILFGVGKASRGGARTAWFVAGGLVFASGVIIGWVAIVILIKRKSRN